MPLAKPGLQGKWGLNCFNEFFSYLCGFLKSYSINAHQMDLQ